MSLRVVVAAGGTAGHVFPGLALARELAVRGHRPCFVGTAAGQEARLVPEAGFPFAAVPATPFLRELSPRALRGPAVAARAVGAARRLVRGADVVIGMGGYASLPTALAARMERVPLALHEQNAVPGLANRIVARAAAAVALGFADAAARLPRGTRTVVTGNPVRESILAVPAARERLAAEAREAWDLAPGHTTLVVFGGSQGARRIDLAAVDACRILASRNDLQVLLITGPSNLEETRALLPAPGALLVRAEGFVERMDRALAVADLVVARAGASSIAEVTVCGLPSVLVPYPYATGRHQDANAAALARAGAADVMADRMLSGEALAGTIERMTANPDALRAMAGRAAAAARPAAAARLADLVEEVAAR